MTDYWYSFGDCPCDAHTIIEIRSASEQPNVNPFHHYPPCPSCGNPLPLRGYWPAPDDGFGGSSGGLDEILGRVRRVVDAHGDEYLDIAALGVALDAWAIKHAPPPDQCFGTEPAPNGPIPMLLDGVRDAENTLDPNDFKE
jgi:hypothetical protein